MKLDIGIGALLRARIRRAREISRIGCQMGEELGQPRDPQSEHEGVGSRSRGGRTRREGALLRKMTCHSRHVPSSPPSCSATERSLLLHLPFSSLPLLFFFPSLSFHFSRSTIFLLLLLSISRLFIQILPCHLRIKRRSSVASRTEFKDWRICSPGIPSIFSSF